MSNEKIKEGIIIEGKVSSNANGSAYIISDDIELDVYINKKRINKAFHLDLVRVEITKVKNDSIEGRVIEILERFRTKFVGTLQVSEKHVFLITDSNKIHKDIYIPLKDLNGGLDGQKALVEIKEWGEKQKSPNGVVIEVLGEKGDNDVEIHSILHEYGLPYEFDESIEEEANLIPLLPSDSEISKRKDIRDVLTFTIDPVDAKDFDDALSFEKDGDNFRVGIHIADVSHYVNPKTELDKEAYNRATSVYLVDRVVPMLPERLSNGVCSLRPNEDKLCFSVIFTLNGEGEVIKEWFGKTAIHSNRRFTYEEAQSVIEGNELGSNKEDIELNDAIVTLDVLAKKMRSKRDSVTFDRQEVRFKLDEDGKPLDLIFKVSKDSNKLIEEFMLLANRSVATYLNKKNIDIPNRIHANPDPIKIDNLKTFISQFGYNVDLSDVDSLKQSLNQLVEDVKGTSEENIINSIIIKSMKKAEYSTDNIGHYGLGFDNYSHFTSPIRRYPDLILHRLLDMSLNKKKIKESKLEQKCEHVSKREIIAQKASRDSIKYKQTEFMADKVNKVYSGIIVSVVKYGLYVEINETKCEGLVRLSDINGDTYIFDEKNYCLKGYNTGEVIRLGDEVNIVVKHVDLEKRNIDLSLIKL